MSGDFDMLAVEPFRVELDRAATRARGRLVVDLRGLSFIDSSGLRALLAGHATLAERGLAVAFVKPPPIVWRVFEVTGTDAVLPFDDGAGSQVGPSPEADGP